MPGRKIRRSLRAKLALGLTVMVTVILGLAALLLTLSARRQLVDDFRGFAIELNAVAEAGIANAMISREPSEVTNVLVAINRRDSVDGVMVLDQTGTIVYSHEQAEVGTALRKTDASCRVCHDRPSSDRTRTVILPSGNGGRLLRVAKPLLNDPPCQGCHEGRVLGMLITDFSLAGLDRRVTITLAVLLLGAAVAMSGVIGAAIAFTSRMVARPLNAFLAVTKSIGEGEVDRRVAMDTGDEIGELAASFDSMMERLAARTRELEALNSLAMTVSQSLELKEVLESTLKQVCEVVGTEWGVIRLSDNETDELAIAASHNLPPSAVETLARLKGSRSLSEKVAETGVPLVVEDLRSDPRAGVKIEAIRSAAVVPLRAQGRVVGTLGTGSAAYHPFSPEEVALLENIGRLLGVAVENSRLYEETHRLSKTDPLTGLANRRAMEERLKDEFGRARRYHHPLSLIMADIDHFKDYNDTHGHPAGDAILRHVADLMRAQARDIDFVARYGGEEFLVILPETTRSGALVVAERIRATVKAVRFPSDESLAGSTLTLSLGIASASHELADYHDLIRHADEALYSAKRSGRDRVCG